MRFFQKGSSKIFVKNWKFFRLFISVKINPENMFYKFLDRKNTFLAYKKKKFKKSKNWHFSKGLVLVQKWPFFQLSFLGNVDQENVFYDILEQKNAFLSY